MYIIVILLIIVLIFIFRRKLYEMYKNTKTRTIVIILSTSIIMGAGIIALALGAGGDLFGDNDPKSKLTIPQFNAIILPKLVSKLEGCGGKKLDDDGNVVDPLIGKTHPWNFLTESQTLQPEISKYPGKKTDILYRTEGNNNTRGKPLSELNTYKVPLDACNYERRAWVGEGGHKESPTTFTNKTKCTLKYDQPPFRVYDCNVEGDDYDNKYEHTLWDTFTRRTINNLNDNQYRYKSSFWPKTHIEVLGTPKISPTFNIATELGRDVFTNERNKLKTKISLVTDLSWESYFHDILDESSPGPRGEYFLNSIDSKDKINLNLALDVIRWPGSNRGWAQRDLLTRMRYEDVGKVLTYKEHREKAGIGVEGGYKITLRTDGDSSKPESSGNVRTFDKFTKGQIYIFYKSNVKYTNFNKKTDREVTGNFWYFITVTGKENKVKANSEISSIVPYGHTDRMIVDTDAEKGASFGDTDSDISDYSHYKNSLGQTKYDFKDRLNSIMKTHNSAAYAIKVNERHSDSGIGFELVGSVFETGDRRDYQVYYKPDPVGTNIELKWEK